MTDESAKRILLITQHYHPTRSSGGRLLSQLFPRLAERYSAVEVLSSNLGGGERTEVVRGVWVTRLKLQDRRSSTVRRGLTEAWFALRAAVRFLIDSRCDVVVVHSSPPFLPYLIGAMCRMRRIPFIYIMYDLYPDFLAILGKLDSSTVLYRLWDYVSRWTLENAAAVVTEGRCVEQYIQSKFRAPLTNLRIVRTWASKREVYPLDRSQNSFFAKGLVPADKFIVQYSGNIGLFQDFDVILSAASGISEDEGILFLIVGDGSYAKALDRSLLKLNLRTVVRMPFQPEELKNELLNVANVALITLKPGMEKIGVPSKIYPALAAGLPILSVMSDDSEIATILREENVGRNVTDRSGRELAKTIRSLKSGQLPLSDSREVFLRRFDVDVAVRHYQEILDSVP